MRSAGMRGCGRGEMLYLTRARFTLSKDYGARKELRPVKGEGGDANPTAR